MSKRSTIEYFLNNLTDRYPVLSNCKKEIGESAELLIETAAEMGKILICGNGGSSADADHIVGELMKGFLKKRPLTETQKRALATAGGERGATMGNLLQQGIAAVSLSSPNALNTAFMNDVDPSLIFAQQVMALGRPNDLLWGISTSGNSKNIAAAVITAKSMGLKTISMTGRNESSLSELSDICIRVEETETYKIQELHLPVYHTLCMIIEENFFG